MASIDEGQALLNFSRKDKIALPVACLTGVGIGYLTVRAGYPGVLLLVFYSLVIVPLIVVFVAGTRKLLVWQACTLSVVACIMTKNASLGGFGMVDALQEFHAIWGVEMVLSFPVPAYYYFQGAKKRKSYRVELFFAGLLFFGLLSSFSRNLFLFLGTEAAWVVAWLVKIDVQLQRYLGWHSRDFTPHE